MSWWPVPDSADYNDTWREDRKVLDKAGFLRRIRPESVAVFRSGTAVLYFSDGINSGATPSRSASAPAARSRCPRHCLACERAWRFRACSTSRYLTNHTATVELDAGKTSARAMRTAVRAAGSDVVDAPLKAGAGGCCG
jgi:hypothetical protein